MANWVQCSRYDEQRSVIWINLDQVVSVREHENGSTFLCAVRDGESPFEIPVWDRLHDIAFAKTGSDG
ncbi:MAG: hypothetical protein ACJ8ER_10915 [Allosphingosinicella sp.]